MFILKDFDLTAREKERSRDGPLHLPAGAAALLEVAVDGPLLDERPEGALSPPLALVPAVSQGGQMSTNS